jgi:phosphate transport system ATP-binding protein
MEGSTMETPTRDHGPSTPAPEAVGQGVSRAEHAAEARARLVTEGITVRYGPTVGVQDVSLTFRDKTVTALIGPSGCGKTTFLRSLNRMHDLNRTVRVTGRALLDGHDIYAPDIDPVTIRRRIGMVFQKPTPFPTMSIYDNVVAGLKLVGIRDKRLLDEVAERSLRQAALWDEVKDRLHAPASGISGGQQQRLSIARALAVEADVLLMDEPTSSLDPQSTMRIEELIHELKHDVTIIIVTHNMQQAARVSDSTAFFFEGVVVEVADTNTMFTNPREARTNDYITGRFG